MLFPFHRCARTCFYHHAVKYRPIGADDSIQFVIVFFLCSFFSEEQGGLLVTKFAEQNINNPKKKHQGQKIIYRLISGQSQNRDVI